MKPRAVDANPGFTVTVLLKREYLKTAHFRDKVRTLIGNHRQAT